VSPRRTEFTDSAAIHESCGLDAVAGISANGDELVPADAIAFVRKYTLRQAASGSWLVVEIFFAGTEKTPCEL
jgi:hypothetical protein